MESVLFSIQISTVWPWYLEVIYSYSVCVTAQISTGKTSKHFGISTSTSKTWNFHSMVTYTLFYYRMQPKLCFINYNMPHSSFCRNRNIHLLYCRMLSNLAYLNLHACWHSEVQPQSQHSQIHSLSHSDVWRNRELKETLCNIPYSSRCFQMLRTCRT
jgi:hypothetical protein